MHPFDIAALCVGSFVAGALGTSFLALWLVRAKPKDPHMTSITDRIAASVHHMTDVSSGAINAFRTAAQAIRDAKGDQDVLNALASELDNNAGGLAAAIIANTSTALPDAGEPAITTGNGGALGIPTVPTAVVSSDPAHGATDVSDVIITLDPADGTVLITPVPSGLVTATTGVSVDPQSGEPAISDPAISLGETVDAPEGTPPPEDAAHVEADTSTVVATAPAE